MSCSRSLVIALMLAVPVAGWAAEPEAAGSQAPSACGILPLSPGDWVRYRVTDPTGSIRFFSFAHVGEEMVDDEPGGWLELSQDDAVIGTALLRVLVTGLASGEARARRMILQGAGQPPFEFPVPEDLPASSLIAPPVPGCAGGEKAGSCASCAAGKASKLRDLGFEKITVPAGEYRAHHHRVEAEGQGGAVDFWVADEVPILQWVKLTLPDGSVFELEQFGHDAKSRMVGDPVALPFDQILGGTMSLPGIGGMGPGHSDEEEEDDNDQPPDPADTTPATRDKPKPAEDTPGSGYAPPGNAPPPAER